MNDIIKHTIIKYLNSEYGDLERYETEEYQAFIFFMKDGKVVFDYNKINGFVGIPDDKIWSFLESFFGLEDEEIQDLTKEWVEEHYNLRVTTTTKCFCAFFLLVEEHYNLRVTTTQELW